MSDDDQRWPYAGMKAFAPPQSGERKFVDLDWGKPYLTSYYVTGFKLAADATVDAATEAVGHPDWYFYPAAFLYRHYIELSLKRLISHATMLIDGKAAQPHGHTLLELWKQLRPYLQQLAGNANPEPADSVEGVVREFHEIDKSGQEFRYETTIIKRKPIETKESLDKAPRRIDLKHLKETMDRVDGFFDGCYGWIDHMLETDRDMRRSWGP
ncbi:MAG: hypothetical protein IPK87_00915 [Planctomycetes bacterium]|nr:hypothetical protein [Planctomycetota bacterium]